MFKKRQGYFLKHIPEGGQKYEYLGSDGFPIDESYNLYLLKSKEFLRKAKEYNKSNLKIKNSLMLQCKLGQGIDDVIKQNILSNREYQFKKYQKGFDVTIFNEDLMSMYNNFEGQSKRIRIIRDINEERPKDELSSDIDEKRTEWFTRFCILSRFIQAARTIIIKNRLEKRLKILRLLNSEDIIKIEVEMQGVSQDNLDKKDSRVKMLLCNYCPNDEAQLGKSKSNNLTRFNE